MDLFQGKNVEYVHQDDNNRRWFNEFRSKSSSIPIAFETVDCECTYINALVPIINVLMYQYIQEILRLTIHSKIVFNFFWSLFLLVQWDIIFMFISLFHITWHCYKVQNF